MSYHCELRDETAQPTLAVRCKTTYHKLPKTIGDGFAMLRQHLREKQIVPAGPMYVKYEGAPAHDFTIEVGVPVPAGVPVGSGISESALPAGPAATVIHRGHYTDLPHAYKALEKWIVTEGHAATGEAYEYYMNDGEHTPPDAWLTRISMPIGQR
ncbi:MAG: GyrI-like domain-containing protein [Gemmatimonadota bacterium]